MGSRRRLLGARAALLMSLASGCAGESLAGRPDAGRAHAPQAREVRVDGPAAAQPAASPPAEPVRGGSEKASPPGMKAPRVRSSAPLSRFFLSGDGALELESAHTGERLRVEYRRTDGSYDVEALAAIDRLFRSRGDAAQRRVAFRLIETIDHLEDVAKPRPLVLQSGYRSGEYNAAVIARGGRAAKSSMHTEGLAADLRFLGVDQHALWLAVRELECCGVGHYASSGFLHVDVGRPRFWEETTSRVRENLSRGNARIIARTEYDRYPDLSGATITLHAVTLRPLRIARDAALVREVEGGEPEPVRLSSVPSVRVAGGCMEFPSGVGDPPITLRIDSAAAAVPPRATRGRILIRTCEPRLEATPAEIATNPIETGFEASSDSGER